MTIAKIRWDLGKKDWEKKKKGEEGLPGARRTPSPDSRRPHRRIRGKNLCRKEIGRIKIKKAGISNRGGSVPGV